MSNKSWMRIAGPVGLVATGLVTGGVLAASLSASAQTPSPSSTTSPGYGPPRAPGAPPPPRGDGNPAHSQRPDEHLLVGDTAAKVRAAALAKYPGATIERVESDSDGVYEAHLVTKAGEHITVEVNKSFAVTGLEAHRPGGPGGHHGGRPNDHDADDAAEARDSNA